MRFAGLILCLFLCGCRTYILQFDAYIVDTKETVRVKVIRALSDAEKLQAQKALKYLESVMDEKYPVDLDRVFIVEEMKDFEGLSTNFRGLGWKIFIGEDNLIKKGNWHEYLKLGWLLAHEQFHCNGLTESQVKEKLDNKILEKLKNELTLKEIVGKFSAIDFD